MLVNKQKSNTHVEFIDYDGAYPALCLGTLILKINGKIAIFGKSDSNKYKEEEIYPRFWYSGGSCGFSNDYNDSDDNDNSYVEYGAWTIDYEDIPDKFKEYAEEIDNVFNENVSYGCCGGCL